MIKFAIGVLVSVLLLVVNMVFKQPAVKRNGGTLCIVNPAMCIGSGNVAYTSIGLILSKIHFLTHYEPATNYFAYQFFNSRYLFNFKYSSIFCFSP